MPRTVSDVPLAGEQRWPDPGRYHCRCVGTKYGKSGTGKHAVILQWSTMDAEFFFEDWVFVTGPALWRLNIVAQRVCEIPGDTALPDDDNEAAKVLARYILDHAQGREATVTIIIETREEQCKAPNDPRYGSMIEVKRHKVDGVGYARVEPVLPESQQEQLDEQIDGTDREGAPAASAEEFGISSEQVQPTSHGLPTTSAAPSMPPQHPPVTQSPNDPNAPSGADIPF